MYFVVHPEAFLVSFPYFLTFPWGLMYFVFPFLLRRCFYKVMREADVFLLAYFVCD